MTAANFSPVQASTANANEPIPAARMAAPEPFVRAGALGEASLFGLFIFLLPDSVESCLRLRRRTTISMLEVVLLGLAGGGAGEQECAFTGVAGKGGGAFELGAGFGVAA